MFWSHTGCWDSLDGPHTKLAVVADPQLTDSHRCVTQQLRVQAQAALGNVIWCIG